MGLLDDLRAMKERTGVPGKEPRARRRVPVAEPDAAWPSDAVDEGDGFVARCVRLMDSAPEKTRAGSEFVHVSALVRGDFCPRAHLLHARFGGHSESVLSQMRIVWTMGRAAEHHLRTQFVAAHGRHRVIGKWSCGCGRTEAKGPGSLTARCGTCGGELDRYGELDLIDRENGISGNPDLVYVRRDGGYGVVECKSIKKEGFAALVRPVPDHVLQCRSYVRLLAKLTGVPVDGRVVYVAKDYISPKVSPYLEFPVPVSEETDGVLDALASSVRDMRGHEAAGTLPPRLPLCQSTGSVRARQCTACAMCFQH